MPVQVRQTDQDRENEALDGVLIVHWGPVGEGQAARDSKVPRQLGRGGLFRGFVYGWDSRMAHREAGPGKEGLTTYHQGIPPWVWSFLV